MTTPEQTLDQYLKALSLGAPETIRDYLTGGEAELHDLAMESPEENMFFGPFPIYEKESFAVTKEVDEEHVEIQAQVTIHASGEAARTAQLKAVMVWEGEWKIARFLPE